ncbi:unnamed protein product [Rotaria sordida]|uniref:OTU domain-containing protein n=1 Tax=Rotaria sordida TaxID=392033 RepID=A0A819W175_9BILA|nr:unnamed protein product [Rotaria sordida]
MNRSQKFARLLQIFGQCSESIVYHDEIASVVQRIRQIESIMAPIQFHPNQVFDEIKHIVDSIAKKYLEKATNDVLHLIPVKVADDGNCLHHSILLLINNPTVTTDELRVRTIIELMTNEAYYDSMYSQFIGSVAFIIKAMCKSNTFSELYEISALCNVLKCNIRSIYPKIDFREDMAIMNNVFTPAPPVIANCNIAILWSHVRNETDARAANNGAWISNHFVPLLSSAMHYTSEHGNKSPTFATPEKKTFKNNTPTRIRNPEFECSPSSRRRIDSVEIYSTQSISSSVLQHSQSGIEEQRQLRLDAQSERARSSRMNETAEHHQIRLEKQKRRDQFRRSNETEQQRQIRLEKQRKRSEASRAKKKLGKHTFDNIDIHRQNIEMQFSEMEEEASLDNSSTNENIIKKKNDSNYSSWPESIPRELKEARLQQFLQHMSMSVPAEATCAICNVRTPMQQSKKVPLSKIPNIHLLKVSDELKNLITNGPSSLSQHLDVPSTFDSSSFHYDNGVILYTNGLFQQNKVNMCTLCQKCHSSLSKKQIPKFSAANNMWLGDVPSELQGLTIPEEKLISLYRHNSCIIKLHSPFHSTTTAQTALKGNCITFLQDVPNIVNSLPLTLDDLCDTLKVIFVGAHPPERIQLKKVLTVRKKKIIEALHWLKKHTVLYQNVDINLKNIAQLPEDDVPECIMTTMEQKIGDEEIKSERIGYIPDPLSDPIERTSTDSIPITNSGVLDVNGSSVSSDEITNYLLQKIKNDGAKEQMDTENVYLIPHSSKPVNEYFNPKLLVGLYPTLFCYERGALEDQSRPVKVNLREHIRYLLSYNDRRFETNHSFIFVVFNLLQRRDACFHAQLIATKPYFRASADEIQSLKSKDIEMALDNISKKTYSSESNGALNKLLHHIKTIGGRVMGSAYSRTALRTRIHALIYNQGLPSIFLTINPTDIHSPVTLYFAGVKLDLDNIQISQLMTTYKRAEIIASHPVATGKFFHLLISNILNTMISGGVLGPIKAYFGTVEMPRSFDTPPRLSQDNIYAALRTIDLTGLAENINKSPVWSTPIKQQLSPSIPYASPLLNKSLQIPTHDRPTSSKK